MASGAQFTKCRLLAWDFYSYPIPIPSYINTYYCVRKDLLTAEAFVNFRHYMNLLIEFNCRLDSFNMVLAPTAYQSSWNSLLDAPKVNKLYSWFTQYVPYFL